MTRWSLIVLAGIALALLGCGGGAAPTAAPAPQQPAPAAQPATAAPAPEPQAALPSAPQAKPAPQPQPSRPATAAVKEPKYGGILVLAHNSDPPAAYDPMRTSTIRMFSVTSSLNGSGNLVRPCPGDVYKVCPGVAESWEANSDFTQWTFKVRDNVKWHDGTPFTAQDAKFWVELGYFGAKSGEKSRSPAIFKSNLGTVERVEVLDGNRLRINLSRPEVHYLFKLYFARNQMAHPPHLMKPLIDKGQADVTPQDIGWVSIGPFKMLKAEKGARVQVRRNDLYWEKDEQGRRLPYLEGVDFAIVTDPGAMDAAFRVGRVEGGAKFPGFTLTKERKAQYVKDLGDQAWYAETLTWRSNFVMSAIKPGPFQDVRVRKAVALWLDKRAALDAVHGGFGYVYSIMGPTNPFVNPDFLTWPGWNERTREADRAEAKRLMAEAGYSKGFQATLLCRTDERDRCDFVIGQMAGLGITMEPKLADFSNWLVQNKGAELETAYDMGAGNTEAFIPEHLEAALLRYSAAPLISNVRHEDPKVDDFFNQLRTAATSFEQRVKVYREMERYLLVEKVYQVPLFGEMSVVPFRAYVRGVVVPQEDLYNNNDYATVWLDK